MRPQEIIDSEREHGRAFGPLAEACRVALAKGRYCECVEPKRFAFSGDGYDYCATCENLVDFTGWKMREGECAVCGGPDEDGNGCEHCPAVTR